MREVAIERGVSSARHWETWEWKVVLAIAALILASNVITGSRSPTVWVDEVMFVDPAANLYLGNGLTSTAWYVSKETPWMSMPPLYELALAGWYRVFGFSLPTTRAFNHLVGVLAALLIWDFVRRADLIRKAGWRIVLFVLLLTGYGIVFVYRSGRMDAFLVMLFTFGVWSCGLKTPALRYALLGLACFLFPLAGLQLVTYAALTGMFLLALFWHNVWRLVTVAGFACFAGLLCLLGVLMSSGQLEQMRDLTTAHMGRIFIGSVGFKEPSYLALFCAAAVICGTRWRVAGAIERSWLIFTLGGALLLPIGIALVGHYPLYYSWMGFLPLAIGLCGTAAVGFEIWPAALRIVLLLTTGVAMIVGLPARLALTALQWKERDYAPVQALAQRTLYKQDWVYADYPAYYAVKPFVSLTLFPPYREIISEEERRRITCLVIEPESFEDVSRFVGGRWRDTGEAVSPPSGKNSLGAAKYNLRVWRRVEQPPF